MSKNQEKLLTINEISQKLRVSRHTVQAWISPSSPNHRPEFAAMARHAGRKTLFIEKEVLNWLNQRRGAVYSPGYAEHSAYWRERFLAGRSALKGIIKTVDGTESFIEFSGGLVGLDTEPLLCWLVDGKGASAIYNLVMRAEGLVLSMPLAAWLLRRISKNESRMKQMKEFLLEKSIFELAPLNEDALRRTLDLPATLNELSLQNYCCCISAGCSGFLTGNRNLQKVAGLPTLSF